MDSSKTCNYLDTDVRHFCFVQASVAWCREAEGLRVGR